MDEQILRDPLLLSALDSAALTRSQCLSILEFLDQNRVPASTPPPETAQLELSKQQKLLTTRLASLRGLYRRIIYDGRATKQQTQEAKSEIDTLHLQLQNLFYEQRHLMDEIVACEDYNHKYQSLPLIPAEEFLASHPELTNVSEQELMIARINDEHLQRQILEGERQDLLKKKQALLLENKQKKDELDVLDKEMEKFINGAASVKKIFDAGEQQALQAV